MDLLLVNEGRLAEAAVIGDGLWVDLDARLFSNDIEIVADTIFDDLVEPAWTGYAPVPLSGLTAPALNGDGKAEVVCDPVVWTNGSGAPVVVYGFALVGPGPELHSARRFDAPLTLADGIPATFPLTLTQTGDPPE